MISDVWDLVNTTDRYPAATPILMAWLSRVDELPPADARERLREGLIRSLSIRDARRREHARPAYPVARSLMVRQFRTVSLDPVRWAAGNAIGIVVSHLIIGSTLWPGRATAVAEAYRRGPLE